ncbi:Quercetin 2,3-dioxygenase [Gemmata obscuriglobus]|uniref:Cupin domain-containing protein n=1 Tax=Gemmata obscuriglobus TaxID=114 RepID=A0A2Z3GQT7_9BACT|nr:cupin domain-containing protein [Gemmata obscuriglobus]AWM36213.1 cupin domain-containing protein [Gemmata obscuriglobus]QEG31189.1 Quercetin 2,3-dioxygenase [Gemmata obscuriglobus]VTS10527.1 Cupin 2, conserved barrel OS=Flavobacteriales bacterium ALC-1 GN=FBALC1_11247 PE=4 SV=1: Cupin_2 [Gemmata obscuriglobus UQM 2246]
MNPKIVPAGEGRRLNVLGDNQLVRLTGADTGGSFTLIEQTNPPGVGVPLHAHANEDELLHVLEGAMDLTVGGRTTRAEAGAVVLLPRNVPHAFVTVGPGITRSTVTAFPAGIEHMFEELGALPPGPPVMETVFEICGRYGIRFLQPAEPGDDLAGV